MRRRTKRKIIRISLLIIILIIGAERLYNSQAKFQTEAQEASHYGIIDVRFTSSEKMTDFKHLKELLEERYPFIKVNERINGIDWFANERLYKRILKNTDGDGEYFVALQRIIGDLNDKDTFLLTGDDYRRFYLHYYPEKLDLFHNIRSQGRYNFFEGRENIKLDPNSNLIFYNGPVLETEKLIEGELAYMRIASMSHYHIEEDYPLIKDFLLDIKDYDKLIIDIRGNDGWADEYWMKIMELLTDQTLSQDYYSFFKYNSPLKNDIYRLTGITTVRDLDQETLASFPPEVAEDMNFYKINTLEIHPNKELDFKGRVYLLVDGEVGAAAEKFAAFAKDTGFATLVGQTTGGGMAFDEVPLYYFSYGGFMLRYSREMAMNTDGSINKEAGTIPHIVLEDVTINKDLMKDKAVQAVISN